jgi:hypothetical protein
VDSWLRDIESARSAAEVLRHARDFCSLMHPRDLEGLPGARELSIDSDADISAARERLSRSFAAVREGEAQRARDLLRLLTHAADRLAELRPEAPR